MTPSEAYKILCKYYSLKPVVTACRNYENYYAFRLAPPGSDLTKKPFVGATFTCVNKSNGKINELENYEVGHDFISVPVSALK